MNDFNLTQGHPTLNDELDLILQQIDILFDTNKRSVFGDENFGTKYQELLYRLNLSADNIKNVINSDLSSLDLFGWSFNTEVYLLRGSEQDIIIIDINLYKGSISHNTTYKIF